MNNYYDTAFHGRDNKRLETMKPTNCEMTAAWAEGKEQKSSLVNNAPCDMSVEEAKEWVDDGSRL